MRTNSSGAPTSSGSVEHALDELDAGRAAAIEVVGEPGIGKTRCSRSWQRARERAGGSCSRARRRSSSATCRSRSSSTRSTSTSAGWTRGGSGGLDRRRPDGVRARLAVALGARNARARRRSSTSATATTARCARCSSSSRRRGRWCWCSTTCTGPTRRPSSCSAHCCDGRRPRAVLMALALRPHQMPERLVGRARAGGSRRGTDPRRARRADGRRGRELLGEKVDVADANVLYEESGGNPFYLEQLARSLDRAGAAPPVPTISVAASGSRPASPPR